STRGSRTASQRRQMTIPGAEAVRASGQDNLSGKSSWRLSSLPAPTLRRGIPLFFTTGRWTSGDASSSARRRKGPRKICKGPEGTDRRERKEHREFSASSSLRSLRPLRFGLALDLKKLANDHGVTFDTVQTGALAELGTLVRPMTTEEQAVLQKLVDHIYEEFLQWVARCRNLTTNR